MDDHHDDPQLSTTMLRQDSGYESITPPDPKPRQSTSSRPRASSRKSFASMSTSSRSRIIRPPTHLAARSMPNVPQTRMSMSAASSAAGPSVCRPTSDGQKSSLCVTPGDLYQYSMRSPYRTRTSTVTEQACDSPNEPAIFEMPPPTTHYWTSDRTRRLEYAAIDAASRGVKGWMLRHVVPDCVVPKANRRVTFDDDTGSVRRYRLDLASEDSTEKDSDANGPAKRRRPWTRVLC